MKGNRIFLKDNERRDIGVGTLIIFIEMLLVAAVASTILIYTTGSPNSFGVNRYFRLIT